MKRALTVTALAVGITFGSASAVHAAPVPDPAVVECGPGMRVEKGVCRDIPLVDLENMQEKEFWAMAGIGAAALLSMLNPFT